MMWNGLLSCVPPFLFSFSLIFSSVSTLVLRPVTPRLKLRSLLLSTPPCDRTFLFLHFHHSSFPLPPFVTPPRLSLIQSVTHMSWFPAPFLERHRCNTRMSPSSLCSLATLFLTFSPLCPSLTSLSPSPHLFFFPTAKMAMSSILNADDIKKALDAFAGKALSLASKILKYPRAAKRKNLLVPVSDNWQNWY